MAAFAAAAEKAESGVDFWHEAVGGPTDYDSARRQHELFDRLSGVNADQRQRNDLISRPALELLDKALNDPVFEAIKKLRHKTIAHAADAFSRGPAASSLPGLKFKDVDRALWILVGVLQVVSATILYDAWRGSAVPVAQHNQFENLGLPLVEPENVELLQEFWKTHADERDGWLKNAHEALLPSPTKS